MKTIDKLILYIPFIGIIYTYFLMKKKYMQNDKKVNILPQLIIQSVSIWALGIYLFNKIFW